MQNYYTIIYKLSLKCTKKKYKQLFKRNNKLLHNNKYNELNELLFLLSFFILTKHLKINQIY